MSSTKTNSSSPLFPKPRGFTYVISFDSHVPSEPLAHCPTDEEAGTQEDEQLALPKMRGGAGI